MTEGDAETDHLREMINKIIVFWAPLNTPLCILILLQNSLVIMNYRKRLEKLASCCYCLIAAADIATAVGFLVLDISSIHFLKNANKEPTAFYYTEIFYSCVGGAGHTISRFGYVFLAVLQTISVLRIYQLRLLHFEIGSIKRRVSYFISLLLLAHLCDAVVLVYAEQSEFINQIYQYHTDILIAAEAPGSMSVLWVLCDAIVPRVHGNQTCDTIFDYGTMKEVKIYVELIYGAIILFLPPIIIMVASVIQVYTLRRLSNRNSGRGSLHMVTRHASFTIIFLGSLYLVCFMGKGMILLLIAIKADIVTSIIRYEVLGFLGFTLPLLNAVCYPAILTLRSEELREMYRCKLTAFSDWLNAKFSQVKQRFGYLEYDAIIDSYEYGDG